MKKIKLLLPALMLSVSMALGCMDSGEKEISDGNKIYDNTLKVKNESKQSGRFCIYQTLPGQDNNKNIYSLVWLSKDILPDQVGTFEWDLKYSFSTLPTNKGIKGSLTIETDDTIVNAKVSIGVGVDGNPAVVMSAFENMTYYFKLKLEPTYWIVFGDSESLKEGGRIGAHFISKAKKITFGKSLPKDIFVLQKIILGKTGQIELLSEVSRCG